MSQKNKMSSKFCFMFGTFRYILCHLGYKVSAKNSYGKALMFKMWCKYPWFTSDWTSDWLKSASFVILQWDFYGLTPERLIIFCVLSIIGFYNLYPSRFWTVSIVLTCFCVSLRGKAPPKTHTKPNQPFLITEMPQT
jgi:hypothetical protein